MRSRNNPTMSKSSSWPKAKTVVKKWLNLKDSEFHSDCIDVSFGGEKMRRRKSCSDRDDLSGGWPVEESCDDDLRRPPLPCPGRYGFAAAPSSTWRPPKELRMFVGTWNVGGRAPHEGLDLSDWLADDGSDSSSSHIYVLGFQEIVPLNAGNVLGAEDKAPARKWLDLIRRALNGPASDETTTTSSSSISRSHRSPSDTHLLQKASRVSFSDLLAADDDNRSRPSTASSEPDDDDGSEPSTSSSAPESSSEEEPPAARRHRGGGRHHRYRLAASKQMVGILLCVWVRTDLLPCVAGVRASCVGRGVMGYMGNKGSVSVSLSLRGGASLCFVCTHLASGDKDGDGARRNGDVADILRRTRFSPSPFRAAAPVTILEHDKVIWLGDLNYRLVAPADGGGCGGRTRELVERHEWAALLERDQLRAEQKAGRVFAGWEEGRIAFPPTYKFVAGSDAYAMMSVADSSSTAGADGSRSREKKKKRTPAWKRSISGPASRIAPNEELALTTAIKTWENRKGDPIFFPYEGTEFNSFEEARDFYNLYSWEVGFGIRISRGRTNDNGYVSKKDLCCSCAGHCPNKRAASSRTGCKAMIRLLRLKDHGWYISRCVATHNHPMSESCGEKQQWPSHGQIDALTMDLIKRLRENNVSTGRVCSILRGAPGGQGMPIRREVIRSVCAKLSQDNIKDDLAKTMRVLEEMKSADQSMDVRFKVDSTGKILRMLWCTGRNKERYKQFGDAITFDTTYRTNLYNLPFGVFVGVNNHFQSTIFGGVLLTNEKTEDFEWAFNNFIDIMGGREPQTILTDQCQAMAAAIKNTMKQTRHRWCKWHVLRKAKQWIGDAYSKKFGFKKEFHQLVTEEVSPMKFERRWRQLIRKYSLEKNSFLKRIYKQRGMWARPYFMGVFCAGMTSTQRSESANHMLKQFIQRSAPMHLFVSKFNEFQFDRIEQEDKEIHLTKQVKRKRRVGVPIERHAEEIYTRAMYERFSNELYYSGSYSIRRSLEGKEFKVAHYKEPDGAERRYFTVNYDMLSKISCSCGLFEHSGMLCRHCLKVLVHLEVTRIPPSNILTRWTKLATIEESKGVEDQHALQAATTADYTLKHMLVKRVLAASGVDIKVSDAAAASAISALEKLARLKEIPNPIDNAFIVSESISSDGAIPEACPERPLRKGRPNSTSLKSYQDGVKQQSRKKSTATRASVTSTTDEENPKSGKTRAIEDLI